MAHDYMTLFFDKPHVFGHEEKIKQLSKEWPEPTMERPDTEQLCWWARTWAASSKNCEATDGCLCKPDGQCEHGYPSWIVYLGWFAMIEEAKARKALKSRGEVVNGT